MVIDWRSWFRDKARVDENRRVMALNVSGQIHQVSCQKGDLTVDRYLETARQVELYVLNSTLPAKAGSVLPMQTVAAMRQV